MRTQKTSLPKHRMDSKLIRSQSSVGPRPRPRSCHQLPVWQRCPLPTQWPHVFVGGCRSRSERAPLPPFQVKVVSWFAVGSWFSFSFLFCFVMTCSLEHPPDSERRQNRMSAFPKLVVAAVPFLPPPQNKPLGASTCMKQPFNVFYCVIARKCFPSLGFGFFCTALYSLAPTLENCSAPKGRQAG